MQKLEGEGQGERVTCVTSGRHEGGVPNRYNHALISLESTEQRTVLMVLPSQVLRRDITR